MSQSSPLPTRSLLKATRISYQCSAKFDTVLDRLYAEVGASPVHISSVSDGHSLTEFADEVHKYVEKSDFMLFQIFNHGDWIKKFGVEHRAVRVIIGNPLIAITMMKHDITAGLFVPVELYIDAVVGQPGCRLTYLLPSSLIATAENPELTAAAEALDAKLSVLVKKVVGG